MRQRLGLLFAYLTRLVFRHGFAIGVFAITLFAAVRIGTLTPSDVDEGFYALAAELVARGRLPYRDFFYPQAPYLPFLLAPVVWVSPSLVTLRWVGAVFVTITAMLVGETARRATRSWEGGFAAMALYLTNELTWQWGPSVRPYGIAGLLITVSVVLISQEERPSVARSFIAGVLVGVAAGTRLLLLPAIAAVVLAVWSRGAGWSRLRAIALAVVAAKVLWAAYGSQLQALQWALPVGIAIAVVGRHWIERARRGIAASVGAAVALVPAMLLYRLAPEGFVFGNLAFHANRVVPSWPSGQTPWWAERQTWVFGLSGLAPMNHLSAFGVELVVMTVFALVALGLVKKRAAVTPLSVAAVIAVAALVPMPVIEHYFTVMVPLMAMAAGMGIGALVGDEREKTAAQRWALPVAVLLALGCAGWPSFHRRWERGIYGEFHLARFRPRAVDAAAAWTRWALQRNPGTLLALWPGSALGVADRVIAGTENHFARSAQLPDDPSLRQRLRVRSTREVYDLVVNHAPSVVTFDREAEHIDPLKFRATLERCGYSIAHEIDGLVTIYVRGSNPRQCTIEPEP